MGFAESRHGRWGFRNARYCLAANDACVYHIRKKITEQRKLAIMLRRFSVSGMRGFAHEVSLDLSVKRDYKFGADNIKSGIITNALLIGKNASGKSSLGDALMDIKNCFLGQVSGTLASASGEALFLNADCGRGTALFEYEFELGDRLLAYSYEKTDPLSLVHECLLLDGECVFDYDASAGRLLGGDLSLVGAENVNVEFANPASSLAAFLCANAPTAKLGALADFRRFVSGMNLIRLDGRPLQLARFDDDIERVIKHDCVDRLEVFLHGFGIDCDLVVLEGADGVKRLFFNHSMRMIPFADGCSSGTRTLVRLFSELELGRAVSLVFIDEFDAYCHFEVADALLRYFSSKGDCQTVCTTHNTSLVKNGMMRPDCIFQIDGQYGVRSLADSTSREIRLGNNVEKLLRAGEFE